MRAGGKRGPTELALMEKESITIPQFVQDVLPEPQLLVTPQGTREHQGLHARGRYAEVLGLL